MKKLFLLLALIISFMITPAYSGVPGDSLILQRNDLYYQYLDIKNNTTTFLMSDYMKLNDVLEQIVLGDNRLLDTLDYHEKIFANLRKSLNDKNDDLNQTKNNLDTEKTTNHYLFIAAVALGLLFIVFFILFIINISAVARIRKQMLFELEELKVKDARILEEMVQGESKLDEKDAMFEQMQKEKDLLEAKVQEKEAQLTALQSEMNRKNLDHELKLTQLNSKLTSMDSESSILQQKLNEKDSEIPNSIVAKNTIIAENEKQIEDLKSEILRLKGVSLNIKETVRQEDKTIEQLQQELQMARDTVSEKEKQFETMRASMANIDNYNKQHDEMDLIAAKIERLENLRNKNIISDLEYEVLKRKFLNEFN